MLLSAARKMPGPGSVFELISKQKAICVCSSQVVESILLDHMRHMRFITSHRLVGIFSFRSD